ncbi:MULTISPECIES: flavin reductase family protein [Thermodesulfovibrio]|jgi:flavin reductase (DIM6/NTAB) family NADH-FMN oxidoreductase RutF|uniref:flavin reductase family protein n=1 Tax=Thermodesulfovibrio TaxID=28261 RepID=UPI00262EC379|nr:flavin reductase family protein [Thermodesulfovibrio sp.]
MREVKENFYRLLHPKVVFFLTSAGKNGEHNVMSCAWATPVSEEPPMIIVCVAKSHYTAELIIEKREFAVNIPTKEMEKAIWICGSKSGRKVDKFKEAKLEKIKADHISAPLIKNCAGWIECRLTQSIDVGECYAFIGEVLSVKVDDRYFKRAMWISDTVPMHLGGRKVVYFKDEKLA